MIWLKELYWGEAARGLGKNLIRAAESGGKSKLDSCWMITVSQYPQGQLDLFALSDLKCRLFDPASMLVVGLAKNKKEAMALLETISRDALRPGLAPDYRAYFQNCAVTDWRGVRV